MSLSGKIQKNQERRMNKSRKTSAVLFACMICDPGNADGVHQYTARLLKRIMMKNSHRPFVSVHLRILLIMSIKTVSDEVMATSSCRLWQAIPDGNLSM